MKKKIIAILSVATAVCAISGLAACSKEMKIEPSEGVYEPALGFTAPAHKTDDGINIDGVLNEAVYNANGKRWYNGLKVDGEERAKVDVTTHFGEEGVYVAYDVEELTNKVYYNPNRSSWLNSGVEMYFALDGTTSIDTPSAFEVDMVCSGELSFKRRFKNSGWVNVETTYDITPVYAAATKGGNYNSDACYGYSGELFIPYDFLECLGLLEEGQKPQEVYINPVLITSYSYDGTLQSDRNWHNLAAADTDGNGWDNPSSFFHFDENGLVSYDIKTKIEGKGTVSSDKGYNFALKNNSLTLNVSAEDNYTLESLTINDAPAVITYKDYKAQIYLPSVNEDLNVKAVFKQVTATPRFVSGNIVPSGVEAGQGITDMQVKYFDGFAYRDLTTVNGAFAGYIPEGECEIVVTSRNSGYIVTRKNITVAESNAPVTVSVDGTMYGVNRAIKFDGITLASGSKTESLNPVTNEKFVFAFRMGVGVDGKKFPADKYVLGLTLNGENDDYVTVQLVRWNGNFETKIFTKGNPDQNLGGIGDKATAAAVQNGYLDFVLVRDGQDLTLYAYNLNGALEKLGEAKLFDNLKDTAITTFSLWGNEGVTPEYGMKLSNCVIYQGTTDLSVVNKSN
mgnify:CR=1 FL=1